MTLGLKGLRLPLLVALVVETLRSFLAKINATLLPRSKEIGSSKKFICCLTLSHRRSNLLRGLSVTPCGNKS